MAWLLPVLLCVTPVRAEMNAADYEVTGVIQSPAQREQAKAEIAREIDKERLDAQRQADEEARRAAAAAEQEAKRPYGERLLQGRCTLCHAAEYYLHQRHTWLGWHVVIGRMRHLNRAPVRWDEQFVLARELVRLRPARPLEASAEYSAGLAVLAAPMALGWALIRWRRASSAARAGSASRV